MIIKQHIPLKWIIYYTWKHLLLLTVMSTLAPMLNPYMPFKIPASGAAMFSAALSIYLGFRSNNAYDRWWEARSIWGLLVNYSRVWARQVLTFFDMNSAHYTKEELQKIQKELIYRHIAYVHALRIFLRSGVSYAHEKVKELYTTSNDIHDIKAYISEGEFQRSVLAKSNYPNQLTLNQGYKIAELAKNGVLSDYRFVEMEKTLIEFSNIQGRSERIKNTPLPRTFSYFQRFFVYMHAIVMPFTFAPIVGWYVLPISFIVNYIFLTIDFVGSRTEDPFENRYDDISLTDMSWGIERTMREMLGESKLPQKPDPVDGILF